MEAASAEKGPWYRTPVLLAVPMRITLAVVLLLVAILAGHFSLDRISPVFPLWLPQVRSLALVATCLLLAQDVIRDWRKLNSPPLLSLAALGGYLILRSAFAFTEPGAIKSAEVFCLLAEALLVAVVARLEGGAELMCATALACAMLLFGIEVYALFGLMDSGPEGFGFAWRGAFGGPITFSRIQFLAFCIVLVLASTCRPSSSAALATAIILAGLYLFGTWGSMQKAAFAASLVVLLALVVAFVLKRDWLMLSVVLASTVIACLLTASVFGDRISIRMQNSIKVSKLSDLRSKDPPPVQIAGLGQPTLPSAWARDVSDVAQQRSQSSAAEMSVRYCYFRGATAPQPHADNAGNVMCYERKLTDFTGRTALAIEALRGLSRAPIFGHGLGSFKVLFIHPEVPDVVDTIVYPHNLLLEVGFEGGLVGIALLLIAISISFSAVLKSKLHHAVRVVTGGLMGFMAIATMVSGNFYDSRLFWLPAILLFGWGKNFEDGDGARGQ